MKTTMIRNNFFSRLSTYLGLLVTLFLVPSTIVADQGERKMYIVYMGSHLPSNLSPESFYDKLMTDVVGREYTEKPSEYLLYTYQRSFYGCVAMLTAPQALQISGVEGVVSVFPNTKLSPHTTRSWDFMGFPINVARTPIERDIIVGILDTGIWPENPSFTDAGLGPVPSKWKGICQKASNFSCNRKIIGARFYKIDKQFPKKEGPTPRDFAGHGSHTASTVAGALVPGTSFFGLGSGTARGGVPGARIAVYKVCWTIGGCDSADILRAFEDAVADGVDVISMSVGSTSASQYFVDTIAIGTFHAMQKGIFTSLSAGNSGPFRNTVTNVAPWLMSVAASTIDRKFVTDVQLGNGQVLRGQGSVDTFDLRGKKFPIIYGGDAPNSSFSGDEARFCESLNRTLVQGKIVLCDLTGEAPIKAGAVGVVVRSGANTFQDGSWAYPLPYSVVKLDDGNSILDYLSNLSRNGEGTIFKTSVVTDKIAPVIADFSSRGPNAITPVILKPDLSAPGVDILAAYSPKGDVSPIVPGLDTRSVLYHIISGTSMACPHASAAAVYVKSYHPDWSPAAIRSALMTTVFPLSSKINADAELAYGAGHINPVRAVDPGLVYDAIEVDYINFLCGQGFTQAQIKLISQNSSTTCPKDLSGFAGDLNYPSISVPTNSTIFNKTFQRRVTSVANGPYYKPVIYKVKVIAPKLVSVKVTPETLRFTYPGQELSYTVQVKGVFVSLDLSGVISASIEWFDGVHKVRSPIVVFHP